MNEPAISVIVPIYNVEKWLRQCLDSILEQTFEDFELILVNDASPDGCIKICRRYEQKDKRIKVIDKQENEGVDLARFSGMAVAQGKYLYFADPDDWLSGKDVFAKMYDKAEETGVDIVFMGYRAYTGGRLFPRAAFVDYTTGLVEQPEKDKCLCSILGGKKYINGSLWGKLWRKDFIERANPKPTGLKAGEDVMFNLQVWPYLKSIYLMDDVGYCYRTATKKERFRPWALDYGKWFFNTRLRLLEEFNVHDLWDLPRIAALNSLRSAIAQRIRFLRERERDSGLAGRRVARPCVDGGCGPARADRRAERALYTSSDTEGCTEMLRDCA